MKLRSLLFGCVGWLGIWAGPVEAVTINLTAGVLSEADGVTPVADGATLMLIASTTDGSFGALTSSNGASATAFTNEFDDVILARFALDSATFQTGAHIQAINFNLGDFGVGANDPLLLVWYPGLAETGNPSQPGAAQRFGTYRAVEWIVPGDNSAQVDFNLLTAAAGGALPEAEGQADQITTGFGPNTPPTAVCRNVLRNAGTGCFVTVTAAEVDNGSFDSDGDPINVTLTPAGPFDVGDTAVTLIVTDNRGGSNQCAATIMVVDVTAPTIVCPSNISTQLPPAQTSVVINFPAPVASDNCFTPVVVSTPASGSVFPLGTNVVTCTASDGVGQSNVCTFTIIVRATPATNNVPVAQCVNVVRSAGPNCLATVTAADVNNGSFDPDADPITLSLLPVGPYGLGTNNVTLTVADDNGGTNSCEALVIVNDTTAPTLTCPSNIVTQAPPAATSVVVNYPVPVALDNCGPATVTSLPASGSAFLIGTTTVTCQATDMAGNTNVCTFSVTVVPADTTVHDFAVVRVKGPKKIKLSEDQASVTQSARVTIQNLSDHAETISNLTGFVELHAVALTNCPNFSATLVTGKPQRPLPVTLRPGQRLTVAFDVTFTTACIPDLRQSTRQTRYDDYRLVATVQHAALDGKPDAIPANDTLAADADTDVYVWFW